jgi:hypothetical protein
VLFLVRAIETRRGRHLALAALSLSLAILAWPFAIFAAALSAMCLLSLHERAGWRALAAIVWALAIAARFLPPSLWNAIGASSAAHDPWNVGVLKWYAGIAVVWFTLEHFLRRAKDWRLPFFALWVFALSVPPLLQVWFIRLVMPEAHRFRLEMEAAVALLLVFGLRSLIDGAPRALKIVVAIAAIGCALPLTIAHRRVAKDVLYPADATRTLEYRTVQRISANIATGLRVLVPGSIGHWADVFTHFNQFSGGEGVTAYNQAQQHALKAVFEGKPAAIDLLKSYGVGAIVVPGAASAEFWKPFSHPESFAEVLRARFTQEEVTLYEVPWEAGSQASVSWLSPSHLRAQISRAGEPVTIPISFHPGWRAYLDGQTLELHSDAFGLIQVSSPRPAYFDLYYDGGWVLRLCGWITILAALSAAWVATRGGLR